MKKADDELAQERLTTLKEQNKVMADALKECLNYLDHGDYPENQAQYILVIAINVLLRKVKA